MATGQVAIVGTQRMVAGSVVSQVDLSRSGLSTSVTTSHVPLVRAPGQSDLGVARVPTGRYTSVDVQVGVHRLSASMILDVAATGIIPLQFPVGCGDQIAANWRPTATRVAAPIPPGLADASYYRRIVASLSAPPSMGAPMPTDLDRALALLGPLEARIMHAAWSGELPQEFLVRDVHPLMPELAYTTVMTTVVRLARKGLLSGRLASTGRRAYRYVVAEAPPAHLRRASRNEARDFVHRYGDAGLAAFSAQLERLSPERREKLRRLAGR